MCNHENIQHGSHALKHLCAQTITDVNVGSLRQKLWNLPQKLFCPIVGVCLPLVNLRALVKKIYLGSEKADDYALHVGVVSECGHRNPLSLGLQREFEKRYAVHVKQFKLAKSKLAVAQLWLAAIEQGDVAGAFWAAATHQRCDAELHDVLYKDMHMLQHQAGACVRADINRYNAVLHENLVLTRELARVQERITRHTLDKSSEMDVLKHTVQSANQELLKKDNNIAALEADLQKFKNSVPDLESKTRLQNRLGQLLQREQDQQASMHDLKLKLAAAEQALKAATSENAALKAKNLGSEQPKLASKRVIPIANVTMHLQDKAVLCVGGRNGNIANYRTIIERVGAKFTHHDGGMEDSQHLLDASLAAADLVICQTGCISHNAYWRVKDFCKRTGKQCVFVENPSTSSLERGLEQLAVAGV